MAVVLQYLWVLFLDKGFPPQEKRRSSVVEDSEHMEILDDDFVCFLRKEKNVHYMLYIANCPPGKSLRLGAK